MRTLFRDLWLADGSGAPLRRSAVLAGDGKILAVEPDLPRSAAGRTVELGGRILAPGFIDVHGHSDLALPARPEGFGKISQGITTEIMGNCGLSAFPLTGRNREHLQELWAQYGVTLDWSDFRGWRAALSARAPKLRAEALVGHNTLRAAVAGYETETLTSAQLEEMKTLLDAELAAGAAGLSSGLLYVPGKFAPPGEIVELMRVAARRDRLYATHLRSEGNELLESLGETIDCAREAGLRRLHISHFKTAGAANWEKLDAALELLEEAQKGGIAVTVDRYPYTESMTQLSVILPGKAGDLDDSALSRLLHSTEEREKLALELAASRPAAYWKTVTLVSTRSSAGRNHAGQTIAALAERAGRTPAEFAVELLAEDAAGTTAAFRGMSPENMRRILGLPFCMMGSDENARPADDSIGRCHPRGFGSAARFLRLRLDAGSPIEAAVRQMTGLAAETFQLADRGLVRPGLCADLAAFDPDEVDGTADFSNPHTPAAGIIFTVTGGEFVYRS